jgi:hypothetical protein
MIPVMGLIRLMAGVLLIPVCVAATQTVVALIRSVQPSSAHAIPPSAWALTAGVVLWQFLYFTLPRPVRSYVLAHELTHMLWAMLMGARISRVKVSKQSGSVTLSRSNFLITLAPYFFPLYTVLVILAYYALSVFVDVEAYYLIWLGLIGLTWGFHLTFTVSTLLQKQSDIRKCGHVFSYTVIYLFNILGIGLWIVAVSAATLEQMVELLGTNLAAMGMFVWGRIRPLFGQNEAINRGTTPL